MDAEIDFQAIFFDVFFECVFASIFNRFLKARNLKNSNFASTGARFLQNRRFSVYSKICLKNNSLKGPKSMENRGKSEKKHVFQNKCCLASIFFNFLEIFNGFGVSFGHQVGDQKTDTPQNGPKRRPSGAQEAPRAPQEAPRGLQEGILKDFGFTFWEAFDRTFGTMN